MLFIFVLCYHSSNQINEWRHQASINLEQVPRPPLSIHWTWEMDIPFIPIFVIPYLSVYILIWLPLVWLNCQSIALLGRQMIVCIVASTVIFLLLPFRLAYSEKHEFGIWGWLYQIIYFLDRPSNLFPSLHISLSFLLMVHLWPNIGKYWRYLFVIWYLLITASVLFTHQHHVLDIFGGLAMAITIYSIYKVKHAT